MHCVAFPRGEYIFSGCVLWPGTFDSYVLPLGGWYNVYVSAMVVSLSSFLKFFLRYTFAVLLSGCRSVMRPGAMWFIKDPQDQNSHPIRDILDRPTLVQLRKIFISGLMYSFVVACVVGSVAGLFLVGRKSIMPFRWKNRYE